MKCIKNFFTCVNTYISALLFVMIISLTRDIPFYQSKFGSISLSTITHFSIFFFISVIVVIISRNKLKAIYPETEKGLNLISIIMIFTQVIVYVLYVNSSKDVDYQSTIALLVSSVLVGSGWWVQAVISKNATRKAHTINTLMTQRNSDLFYKNNKEISDAFGVTKTINEKLVRTILTPNHADVKDSVLKKKYISPANKIRYVLNYYEFICAGVNNGDLDKDLIKECLDGIVKQLEVRFFYFIKIAREDGMKTEFNNILILLKSWSGSTILNIESGGQAVAINQVFEKDSDFLKDKNAK